MARSLGIALVALVACADAKPERPKPSGSVELAARASSSASAPQPSASASAASASPDVDVSYPDDTIPAPRASAAPSVITVSPDGAMEIIKGYAKQAGSLRSRPTKEGIKIRNLRPEDGLSKVGLRDADFLQDINGFDMSDPDKAVDAYARLRRAGRMDIRFVRDGKPMTIIVEVK